MDAADRTITWRQAWRLPPRWLFHIPLGCALLVLLWSGSYPGLDVATLAFAALALLCFGLVWLIRMIGWVTSRTTTGGLTWLLAPPMVIATMVLMSADVPLRARFELARGDFDAYVSDLDPQGGLRDWVRLDAPPDLGTYEIREAWQAGENVIIVEATGALLDDAGFAYLPHGPDERLENGIFEAPSFHSLGGGWYSWTAGW